MFIEKVVEFINVHLKILEMFKKIENDVIENEEELKMINIIFI